MKDDAIDVSSVEAAKKVTRSKNNNNPVGDPLQKASWSKNNDKPTIEEEELKDDAINVSPVEAVKKVIRSKNNNNWRKCRMELNGHSGIRRTEKAAQQHYVNVSRIMINKFVVGSSC
jgi:hypothetical protein